MKKTILACIAGALLFGGNAIAEEAATPSVKTDGFYLGIGGGRSAHASILSSGKYYDGNYTYNSSELSDADMGYIVYGGYQFNRIIAVEAAYTDYGSFSDTATNTTTLTKVKFKADPTSFSLYANAGYTFDNGLRPFGQIGLGYLRLNGSNTTEKINIDDGASLRVGLGLDYAPKELIGFGFRFAYVYDITMDFNYESDDSGIDRSVLLTTIDGLLYIGAQYRF